MFNVCMKKIVTSGEIKIQDKNYIKLSQQGFDHNIIVW